MGEMTLREICEAFNISRRAIQGYEKEGLVSASKKSERGYLLYEKAEQDKIREIRFYQQLGFKLKEIKELMGTPDDETKERLRKQVLKLENENKEKEELIQKAYELINKL